MAPSHSDPTVPSPGPIVRTTQRARAKTIPPSLPEPSRLSRVRSPIDRTTQRYRATTTPPSRPIHRRRQSPHLAWRTRVHTTSRVRSSANKYRILRLLGQGGFGTVYEAKDEMLGASVAVKVLNGQAARYTDSLQQFLGEARLLTTLDHPNIVRWITFRTARRRASLLRHGVPAR
jgi:hypothetical protein